MIVRGDLQPEKQQHIHAVIWARVELGRLNLHGINVKQDLAQAYLWYALAAQTGLVNAADFSFKTITAVTKDS